MFDDAVPTNVEVAPDGGFVAFGYVQNPEGIRNPIAVWRSVDGQRWHRIETGFPDDMTVYGLDGGPRGLVVAGVAPNGHQAWWSADGTQWRRVLRYPLFGVDTARSINEVHAGLEGFVLAGHMDNGHGFVMASSDGRDWIEAPPQPALDRFAIGQMAPQGGDWFAIAGHEPFGVWASENGLDWSERQDVVSIGGTIEHPSWFASAGDLLLLETSEQNLHGPTWVSSDGTYWYPSDLVIDLHAQTVTEFRGRLVLLGLRFNGQDQERVLWKSDVVQ